MVIRTHIRVHLNHVVGPEVWVSKFVFLASLLVWHEDQDSVTSNKVPQFVRADKKLAPLSDTSLLGDPMATDNVVD